MKATLITTIMTTIAIRIMTPITLEMRAARITTITITKTRNDNDNHYDGNKNQQQP